MTKHNMSAMEALSFPEGTAFVDGLGQRLVRHREGFFCADCDVTHDAHNLQFTSLKLEEAKDTEDEFTVSGLDTRFVHRDDEGDFWIYFSKDEQEEESHAGWIFGSSIERAFSKAKIGGFAWLDMSEIDFPDEGKNLCRKDDILGFYLNNPGSIVLREFEADDERVPSIEESLARIAKALEKNAEVF